MTVHGLNCRRMVQLPMRRGRLGPALIAAHRIFNHARGADQDLIRHLLDHDVHVDACTNVAGPIVRLTVAFEHDAFAYDRLGEAGAVVCAHDVDAETVIDLVAWSLRSPELFATFLGGAGLLGGDAIVNPASFHSGPCPIWSTPLRWLQSGCSGAVLLNAGLARSTFSRVPLGGWFVAENLDLAHQLVAFGLVPPDHLLVPNWRRVA